MKKINQYTQKLSEDFHRETSADLLANDKAKLKLELIERAGVKNPSDWSILDIGCAGGVHAKFLADTFPEIKSIIGIDLSPEIIAIAEKENSDPRIKYIVSDMDDMPFQDKSFDFIFSRNTIHYSEDLKVTFKEIHRVLRPRCQFYFQDSHPIFSLFLKPSKDYEKKEMVSFPIQGGQTTIKHPSFMLSEYVGAVLSAGFEILKYGEYFGRRSQVGEFRIPPMQGFLLKRKEVE